MPTSLPKSKKLISISEAAKVLGVSIDTIRRWDKKGVLHSQRPDGKNRFFSISELEEVKFAQPLPISEASKYLGISQTTLRRLEGRGLIKPDRNQAGERVYDKQSLEKFLNSEYFLRQTRIEEKILEPLKRNAQDIFEEPGVTPTNKVLTMLQAETSQEVGKLVALKKFILASGLFGVTLMTSALVIITMLFLVFPEQTAHFFGYAYRNSLSYAPNSGNRAILGASTSKVVQTSISDRVLGVALRPLSGISLGIIKQVAPETYKKIIPPSGATSESELFTTDDQGNIVPNVQIKLPDISYLKVEGNKPGEPPQNLIQQITNISSTSATTEVIGLKEVKSDNANLTVTTLDNVSTLSLDLTDSIGSAQIKDGSVTSAKLSGISVLTDDSIKTSFLKDGVVTNSKLSQITDSNKIAGSAVQLSSTGGLTNNSGLSLLTSCSSNQVLSWNGSAWICTTPSAGGGVTSVNSLTGALTIAGGGINSVSASGTTVTVTGTEADTLATVTGRGATTSVDLTLNGNVGIGSSLNVSGNSNLSTVNLGGLLSLSGSGIIGGGLSSDCSGSTQKLTWRSSDNTFDCGTDLNTGGGGGAGGWVDYGSTVGLQTITANVGIGTSQSVANAKAEIQGGGNSTNLTLVTHNAARSIFGLAVLDNGNVGIGTTLPTSQLQTTGNVEVGGSLTSTSAIVGSAGLKITGNANLGSLTAGVSTLGATSLSSLNLNSGGITNAGAVAGVTTIDTSGNIGVGGSLTVTSGAVFSAGLTVSGNANLGSLTTGALNASSIKGTSLDLTSGGITNTGSIAGVSTLTTTGNVGVGGSLSVTGIGTFSGNVGIGGSGSVTSYLSVGSLSSTGAICLAGDCRSVWPSGGGESTTVSNGLTLSGFDVSLGGTLTRATGIDINQQSFGFLGGNVGVGTTNPDYNFKVLGTGFFSGFVGIGSSLNVTGNVGVGGSLSVTSGLSLPNSSITNANLVNSSIIFAGDSGSSATSLGGTRTFAGANGIGTTESNGTVTITGINASTSVKGVASFNSTNFTVSSGAVNLIQDIATTSTPTFAGLTTTGNLGVGLSLSVTGISTLSGNVGVGNSLTVTSVIVGSAGLKITGNANLGSLTAGVSTLGATSLSSLNLNSGGITNAGAVAGVTTIDTSGNIGVGGSLTVTSGVNLSAGLVVAGNANLGTLTAGTSVLGATTLSSLNLSSGGITNAGAISGATTVNSSSLTTTGNVGVGASLSVTGISTLSGNVGVGNSLTVTSAGVFSAGLTVSGNANTGSLTTGVINGTTLNSSTLTTTGNVGVGGSLTVTSGVSFSSSLAISGNTNLSTVNTSGAANFGDLVTLSTSGISGGGLTTDCSNLSTSKLLWRSSDNQFVCGSDQNSGGAGGAGGWTDDGATVRLSTGTDNVGIGTTASYNTYARLQIQGSGSSTALSFLTTDSAGTQRFAILDNGNVGIGTTLPSYQLQTTGNVGIGGSLTVTGISTLSGNVGVGSSLSVTSAGVFSAGLTVTGNTNLGSLTTGVIKGTSLDLASGGITNTGALAGVTTIDTSGNVGVGGSLTSTSAIVGSAGLTVAGNANTGSLTTGAINSSTLNTTGNVGVGGSLSVTSGLSLPNSSVTNAALVNSSLTVSAGTGLTGGGLVSLGNSTSISLDLTSANAWTGIQTFSNGIKLPNMIVTSSGNVGIGGSAPTQLFQINPVNANPFVVTSAGNVGINTTNPQNQLDVVGNVGISSSLSVTGISTLSGNVGVGNSLTVTSAGVFSAGLTVTGNTNTGSLTTGAINSSTLNTTGNTGVGGSLTVTSAGVFSAGITVSGNANIGTLTAGASVLGSTSLTSLNLNNGGITNAGSIAGVSTIDTSGNVGVGGSLTVTSAGVFSAGLTVTGNTNLGSLTTGVIRGSSLDLASGGLTNAGAISGVSTITTTGNVGVGGSLSVTGISTLSGNVGVGNSLTVTSAGVFSAGLTVTGNANTGSLTTGALNATTINGSSLTTTGNVGVGASLSVTSAAVFSAGLTVTGNANLGSLTAGTSVLGATSLTSLNLNSGGITNTGSIAGVTTIDTSGNVGVGGSLSVTSYLSVGSLSSTGAICLAGDCRSVWPSGGGESTTVSNGLTLSGFDVSLGGTLTRATGIDINQQSFGFLGGNVGVGTTNPDYNFKVLGTGFFSGFVGIGSSLNVTGNVGVGSSLSVTGISTLSGNVGIGTSLTVTNISALNGGLKVTGFSDLTGSVGIGTSLTVTNITAANGGLKVTGLSDLTGNVGIGNSLIVTNVTAAAGGLKVTGFSDLTGNVGIGNSLTVASIGSFAGLKVTGFVDLTGNVGIGSSLSVAGISTLSGNVGVGNSLTVTGLNFSSGGLRVNGFSDLTGNVGVGTSLIVGNVLSASTGLKVSGFSDLTGNVGVGGSLSVTSGLSLPNSSVTNAALVNSALTVSAGTGLTGGGAVSLGGSVTLNAAQDITTTGTPTFSTLTLSGNNQALTFSGTTPSLGTNSNNSFSIFTGSGNVGIGTSSNLLGALTVRGLGTTTGVTFQTYGSNLTQGLTVLDNGNVGIGTTSPRAPLDVIGNGTNAALFVSGNVGIGFTTPTALLHLLQTGSTPAFRVDDIANDTSPFLINDDGNVGIGTTATGLGSLTISGTTALVLSGSTTDITTPGAEALGINSGTTGAISIGNDAFDEIINLGTGNAAKTVTVGSSNGASALSLQAGTGTMLLELADNTANTLGIRAGGIYYITVNSNDGAENLTFGDTATNHRFIFTGGNVGIGVSIPTASLQVQGNVGIGYSNVVIPSNGLAVSGNVGIGTTSPNFPLHVIGNVGISSSLTLGSNLTLSGYNCFGLGNNGKLTTDSSGNVYCAADISGGGSQTPWTGNIDGGGFSLTNVANITTTGNIGVGGSLVVTGNVGVGGSLTVTSATSLTRLNVSQHTTLNTLGTSGNINVGGSAYISGNLIVAGNTNIGFTGAVSDPLGLAVRGNVGIGTTSPVAPLQVQGNGTTSGLFLNGNVGIGWTSPLYALHVVKSVAPSNGPTDILAVELMPTAAVTAGMGPGIIFKDAGGTFTVKNMARIAAVYETVDTSLYSGLAFYVNNSGVVDSLSERMRLSNTGNLGIGTTTPGAVLGVAGNATIGFGDSISTPAGPNSGLAISGNVGIGTTTPDYPLHVIGNVGIGSSLTVTGLTFSSGGLRANGFSDLTGNVGIGASLTVSSTGAFRLSGQNCSGLGNNGKLTTDSGGNVYCASDVSGGAGLSGGAQNAVAIWSDASNLTNSVANFYWDPANYRLGIGTSNPQYTLDVSGTGYFSDFVGIGSSLNVSGNVGIGNSLTVTSATSLTRLDVSQHATFNTLGTTGNVGLGASLTVTNILAANGGLKVVGFSDLTGNVGIGNSLIVTKVSALNGGLKVTGFSDLTGNVGVGTSLTVTNILAANGGLKVTGLSDLTGNVGIGTSLSVANVTALNAGLKVTGFSDLTGNVGIGNSLNTTSVIFGANGLKITGFSDLTGNVGIGNSLTVASIGSFAGLKVTGFVDLTGNVGIGSSLSVAGISTLSGNVGVGNSLTVTGLNFSSGGLRVNGFSDLTGNVGVGTSLIVGNVLSASTGLKVSGFSDLTGNVGIGTSLNVTNVLSAAGGLKVSGFSDLTGNVGVGNSLIVGNVLSARTGLKVSGFSDLTGNVGIGNSLNVTNVLSAAGGLKVSGFSDLTGNVGIGASLTVSSTGAFRLSGQNCSGLGNNGKLTTDSGGNVYCAADIGGGGSQTPWTSDIDAAGFNLTNAGNITAKVGLSLLTTTTGELNLDSGSTGNVNLGFNVNAKNINIGTTGNAAQTINIGKATSASTIGIGNGSAGATVTIGTGTLGSTTINGPITLSGANVTSSSGLSLKTTTTGELNLDSGSTGNVLLGFSVNAKNINIGTTGNAADTITIGGSTTAGSIIKIGTGVNATTVIHKDFPTATTPLANMVTNGTIYLGSVSNAGAGGRIWIKSNGVNFRFNSASNAGDFSEFIAQSEPSEQGDVMVIDPEHPETVRKSRGIYEENILGVITIHGTGNNAGDDCTSDAERAAGDCARDVNPNYANVGMLGQVDVKVITENGPIKIGDRLTTSSLTGVAMKATKAGQVIGRALRSYDNSDKTQIGKVLILVSPSYYDPSVDNADDISQLQIEAQNASPYTAQISYAKAKNSTSGSGFGSYSLQGLIGGIFDNLGKFQTALIANLRAGVVESQQVSTDTLTANQGAFGDIYGSSAILDKLVINGSDGSPVVTIDSNGNAFFAGTITAKSIQADQVSGLKIMTDELVTKNITPKLDQLAQQIATASGQTVSLDILIAQASASARLVSKFDNSEDPMKLLTGLKIDKGLEIALDAKILGKLEADGGLIIGGPAEFKQKTLFDDIAEFIGNVIFHGDVSFEGRPTFNKDTAGFAVVSKGADTVEVSFDKEYANTPLVNTSITLDNSVDASASASQQLIQEASQSAIEQQVLAGDIRYIVTRRTTKGFTIKINKSAPTDLKFSWTALAVKDVQTAVSKNTSSSVLGAQVDSSPSATPTPSPEASSSASPSAMTIKINPNELGYLRVRSEASTAADEVGQVLPGQLFTVLVQKDGWYEIEYKTDFYGWVSGSYVQVQ